MESTELGRLAANDKLWSENCLTKGHLSDGKSPRIWQTDTSPWAPHSSAGCGPCTGCCGHGGVGRGGPGARAGLHLALSQRRSFCQAPQAKRGLRGAGSWGESPGTGHRPAPCSSIAPPLTPQMPGTATQRGRQGCPAPKKSKYSSLTPVLPLVVLFFSPNLGPGFAATYFIYDWELNFQPALLGNLISQNKNLYLIP